MSLTKTQEYLKRKKLKELNLPTSIYMVYSSPEGVNKTIEIEIIDVIEIEINSYITSFNRTSWEKETNKKYILKNYYEVIIPKNKTSYTDMASGSGFGDLWGYTRFYSLSKEECEKYYEEEVKRVDRKYLKVIKPIIIKGFVQCIDGFESCINTQSGEMIKVIFNNKDEQLKYDCKHVKVTIEVIDESDLDII